MKKVKFTILVSLLTIGVSSCGSTKETTVESDNEPTFEEKIVEVCDCFEKAGNDSKERPKCFQLQDKYSKEVGEKKKDFLQETNKCM